MPISGNKIDAEEFLNKFEEGKFAISFADKATECGKGKRIMIKFFIDGQWVSGDSVVWSAKNAIVKWGASPFLKRTEGKFYQPDAPTEAININFGVEDCPFRKLTYAFDDALIEYASKANAEFATKGKKARVIMRTIQKRTFGSPEHDVDEDRKKAYEDGGVFTTPIKLRCRKNGNLVYTKAKEFYISDTGKLSLKPLNITQANIATKITRGDIFNIEFKLDAGWIKVSTEEGILKKNISPAMSIIRLIKLPGSNEDEEYVDEISLEDQEMIRNALHKKMMRGKKEDENAYDEPPEDGEEESGRVTDETDLEAQMEAIRLKNAK